MEQNYYKKYLKYKSKYLQYGSSKDIQETKPIKAIAYFDGLNIRGSVLFEEISNPDNMVKIKINLSGFEPNSQHGFHIHEYGDLSKGCDSTCAHFNPYNKSHGGRDDAERHVGDLGNIIADSSGICIDEFTDHLVKLRGVANVIGRGLVIHEDFDDCGKGNHPTSKTTGNSGKRIICAVIGLASNCV